MRKVWIEVALNGAWSSPAAAGHSRHGRTDHCPGCGLCAAGAAIIHTHAYAENGGQTFDWQVYARIIEGIRAPVDVPVYPSYPKFEETGIEVMPPRALPISRPWPTVACSTSP